MTPVPDVRVHVASFNTAAATELCIRSMRATAGHPFSLVVGDSGSTDGTLEMLEHFAEHEWLDVERSGPRTHHDWLDIWLQRCSARFAVFADSDIEFLRLGWLSEMVRAAERTNAVAVYTELLPEIPRFVFPMVNTPAYAHLLAPYAGRPVRLVKRPAAWLFLVHVTKARTVNQQFGGSVPIPSGTVPEGHVMYDTGGAFFHELVAQNLPWTVMDPAFADSYRHYISQSWLDQVSELPWRLRLHHLWNKRVIGCRLRRMRRLHPV